MAELSSLRNIGNEIEKKLKAIDITTAEELKKVGSKEAFFRLKMHYPNVCLVHLYVLEGAISPEDVKRSLKEFSESFR